MFNRVEMKQNAKLQLKGNWNKAALITFVYFLVAIGIQMVGMIPLLGGLIAFVLSVPLSFGYLIVFLNMAKKETSPELKDVFDGFSIILRAVGITLWMELFVILWSLLLVIPGVVKTFAYSQSFYIIAENSNVGIRKALKTSIKMTKGYKMDIFIMYLSFFGWALLAASPVLIGMFVVVGSTVFSSGLSPIAIMAGMMLLYIPTGIAYLWLLPYMNASNVNMYLFLKSESIQNGVCVEEDFTGIPASISVDLNLSNK